MTEGKERLLERACWCALGLATCSGLEDVGCKCGDRWHKNQGLIHDAGPRLVVSGGSLTQMLSLAELGGRKHWDCSYDSLGAGGRAGDPNFNCFPTPKRTLLKYTVTASRLRVAVGLI